MSAYTGDLSIKVFLWISIKKGMVKFLRSSTLGSPIEFKHLVTLINETQTMLSFLKIFKFNVFEFN